MKEPTRHLRRTTLICLALGVITLGLYLPALRHDFLAYDDQIYVTENPRVLAGLTGDGLVWAFGNHASNWHPLTWLSHMVDCQLYDAKPAGHHLTNVLLHVGNTVLLFLILQRMTGAPGRSACVAALFGWHPLHVESVAWVAERKDVLSAFFFLLTIGAYIRFVESSRRLVPAPMSPRQESTPENTGGCVFYSVALFFFALALMSKPMVVTLPFVLLLLDYWPLQRFKLKTQNSKLKAFLSLLWEKVPFLALSALGCGLTLSAQSESHAIVSTAALPISQRMQHAAVAYLHYLKAMIVPRGLAVYYPYETSIGAGEVLLAGMTLVCITALAVWFAARRAYFLTGWLWFLGMLVPVIGLVQVGEQAWADRYTYLPLIGLFLAIVWGAADFLARKSAPTDVGGYAKLALGGAAGLALLAGTSAQVRHWKDTRALFEHAVNVTRDNYMALSVLGSVEAKEGRLAEAMGYYRTALRHRPGYAEAHFLLGNALDQQGKTEEAIAEYRQALRFKPVQEQAHILLGAALAKQKQHEEASVHYLAALKLNPDSATAHNNLARLLHTQGRLDQAIEHYTRALQLDRRLAPAHNNLGVLLLQKGRVADGVSHLREAMRLNPADPEAQYNLAVALNREQQWGEAVELFAKAVGPDFGNPEAHYQFGVALAHLGRTREAMSQYAAALLLQPDFPDALDGLAWILATAPEAQFRNGAEAVHMSERACHLTKNNDPQKLKTLAAAYAENGRLPEATNAAQSAHDLAVKAGRDDLARECQRLRESFQSAKPWRETPPRP